MATKEVKELSIETIKKELIDKFTNNMDILRYLEVERHDDVKLLQVKDAFVYDYDNPNVTGDFITVDVAENIFSKANIRDSVKYVVSIKIGLGCAYNLDKIAAIIKEIVFKEYPYIKRYSNVPIYVKKYGCDFLNSYHEYNELNRMITFEIWNQA